MPAGDRPGAHIAEARPRYGCPAAPEPWALQQPPPCPICSVAAPADFWFVELFGYLDFLSKAFRFLSSFLLSYYSSAAGSLK